MISGVHLVLFDLGNTLFYDNADAWPKVYARAEAALWRDLRRSGVMTAPAKIYGKSDTLLGYYYSLRGTGVQEPGTFRVLRGLLAPHVPDISDASVTRALRAMYKVTQTNWKLEHDSASTLRVLHRRGFQIGAVSNGSDDWNALELLNRAGLRRYFDLVLTSAAHGRRKPSPSIFLAALDHFHVEADHAVMIGDSYEADILGASALGLRTIWITGRAAAPIVPVTTAADAALRDMRGVPALLA